VDVKAIVLVAGAPQNDKTEANIASTPFALADVVGRPAVHHLVRDLQRQNVCEITVVSETSVPPLATSVRQEAREVNWIVAEGHQLWRAAEEAYNDLAQNGAEEILVVRLGAYVELDLDSFLQAHLDNRTHATRAIDEHGSEMDLFVVTGSRRNEAAYLFRHRLAETRSRCGVWRFRGYRNALQTSHHLRCLAVDALLGENSITPKGEQVRPGVWIGRGAQVHSRARVLAPAYIGENAKVRCNAVVTRCSVVEHHVEIDFGTVVEDASVLPYTYVGPGLDIIRSVVGCCRVASLDHGVEVEIADPRLLRGISPSAGRRALASVAAIAAFVPVQLFRGLFRPTCNHKPAELSAAVSAPSSLNTPAGFPAAPSAVEASSYNRTWQ
jgi:NDP-sugar pyrophosphorylase family protein